MIRAVLIWLTLGSIANADTIRLINNTSWNGAVSFSGRTFMVTAGDGRSIEIPAEYVERVEFNYRDTNPNPPPDVPSPRDVKQNIKCQAVGKGNLNETGTLEKIENGQIVIRGKTVRSLQRQEVELIKIIH
jgi:hypothetical protein